MVLLCWVCLLRVTDPVVRYSHQLFFFFFKQKTAYEMRISDLSSDVCSSDLDRLQGGDRHEHVARELLARAGGVGHDERADAEQAPVGADQRGAAEAAVGWRGEDRVGQQVDRKSTRLNSSP